MKRKSNKSRYSNQKYSKRKYSKRKYSKRKYRKGQYRKGKYRKGKRQTHKHKTRKKMIGGAGGFLAKIGVGPPGAPKAFTWDKLRIGGIMKSGTWTNRSGGQGGVIHTNAIKATTGGSRSFRGELNQDGTLTLTEEIRNKLDEGWSSRGPDNLRIIVVKGCTCGGCDDTAVES